MKNRLIASFLIAASVALGGAELGDYGMDYPLWSVADPFAIAVATNNSARITAEAALRVAGDLAGSNNVTAAASTANVATTNEVALRVAGDLAGSNNVTALSGTVTALSGTVTATNALFNAWFAGLFSETNKWTAAYGWGNWAGPVASNAAAILVLQTNTLTRADGLAYVTKEAFSTNRVTRWYDPEDPNRFGQLEGGTNIVIYRSVVSGTNFVVTLSSDFLETTGSTRPAWTNHVWPFGEGDWDGIFSEPNVYQMANGVSTWLAVSDNLPATLIPHSASAQGTATVSIASFNLTTNVEWRYFLPTNAIPPELSNLDALQGWLNNLYAGKADFTNHTSTASIHVPIFIGTTNELPLVANRTNGVLYVEIP